MTVRREVMRLLNALFAAGKTGRLIDNVGEYEATLLAVKAGYARMDPHENDNDKAFITAKGVRIAIGMNCHACVRERVGCDHKACTRAHECAWRGAVILNVLGEGAEGTTRGK